MTDLDHEHEVARMLDEGCPHGDPGEPPCPCGLADAVAERDAEIARLREELSRARRASPGFRFRDVAGV